MCRSKGTADDELLKMQNALIRQKIDEIRIKNELDDLYDRADFYENMYNQARKELYDQELKCKEISEKLNDLKEEKEKGGIPEKDNIHNLGSMELIKIVFKRLIKRLKGR